VISAAKSAAPFKFVKEDLAGSQPKVLVTDARRRTWSVKWGHEVRAEAFADSTDWDATAAAIKGLQAEWKAIGPSPKQSNCLAATRRGARQRRRKDPGERGMKCQNCDNQATVHLTDIVNKQKKELPFLAEYARDLTAMAHSAQFDPLIEDKEAESDETYLGASTLAKLWRIYSRDAT
jgi:hypothetical protein